MSNALFNGYRLDLKSGLSFAARATKINHSVAVPEGRYILAQTGQNSASLFSGSDALACASPNQTLATTHSLKLIPESLLYSPISQFFLYDFCLVPTLGIKTEQTFFRCLGAFNNYTPSNRPILTVKYAAPWMQTAEREIGQREVSGIKANPRILEYFKSSQFWGKDDSGSENAWCASFVSWIMEQHGYTPPKYAFRAKAWEQFGKKISDPIFGAIGVKSRTGGGHVAFVMGKSSDGKKLYMLGGNQNDEVNVSEYAADVWDSFVVPPNYDSSSDTLPIYTKLSVKAGTES